MFTWLSFLTVNFCIFSYISILFLLITLNSHIFYQNKFQIQNLYESIFIMVKFILVIIYYFIFNCTKTAELILTQHSILNSDQHDFTVVKVVLAMSESTCWALCCRLFKQCQNLPAGHCVTVVKAVLAMWEST